MFPTCCTPRNQEIDDITRDWAIVESSEEADTDGPKSPEYCLGTSSEAAGYTSHSDMEMSSLALQEQQAQRRPSSATQVTNSVRVEPAKKPPTV